MLSSHSIWFSPALASLLGLSRIHLFFTDYFSPEPQVGHQGVFVTEATKDAPVVDVFHALEVKTRQHLLGTEMVDHRISAGSRDIFFWSKKRKSKILFPVAENKQSIRKIISYTQYHLLIPCILLIRFLVWGVEPPTYQQTWFDFEGRTSLMLQKVWPKLPITNPQHMIHRYS